MSSPTLTDKVSKMIYQDILTGELKPEQKLIVAELKVKYNVGASPIREALTQLSWDKYVTLEPQKGCWVSTISKNNLDDLFDNLLIVSSVLLKKTATINDDEWELAVLSSFHKFSKLNKQKTFNLDEWENHYYQFYYSLLGERTSKIMFGFFTNLFNQAKRYRYFANASSNINVKELFNITTHEIIMKLVLAKDINKAAILLEKYLHTTKTLIERTIAV